MHTIQNIVSTTLDKEQILNVHMKWKTYHEFMQRDLSLLCYLPPGVLRHGVLTKMDSPESNIYIYIYAHFIIIFFHVSVHY